MALAPCGESAQRLVAPAAVSESELVVSNKCIYELIEEEVKRQRDLWGEQNHPDKLAHSPGVETLFLNHFGEEAEEWRGVNSFRVNAGHLTWDGILLEKVYEALAESDPDKLTTELIQAAAVIVNWVDCIKRRKKNEEEGSD